MKIQINFGDVPHSGAIESQAHEMLHSALDRFEDRVTRVEAHLRDDKASRAGSNDMRCVIEIRLAGLQPMAVEGTGRDLYGVIRSTVGKAERAVRNKVERRDER